MKNSNHILTSLLQKSRFKKLSTGINTHSKLQTLKLILPLEMRKNIICISYKPCSNSAKLLFCFKHPSYSFEFNNYKIKDIIYCLKNYADEFSFIKQVALIDSRHCNNPRELKQIGLEIRGYVPSSILKTLQQPTNNTKEIRFKEHSKGEFNNLAKDNAVFEAFERIRQHIKNILKKENL